MTFSVPGKNDTHRKSEETCVGDYISSFQMQNPPATSLRNEQIAKFTSEIVKPFIAVCANLQRLEERIHEAVPESITKGRLEALYLAAFTTV